MLLAFAGSLGMQTDTCSRVMAYWCMFSYQRYELQHFPMVIGSIIRDH